MPVIEHPVHEHGGVEWMPIVGYEDDYMVSKDGDVASTKKGKVKLLKPSLSSHGYMRVNLCFSGKSKLHYVHELVAAAFIGQRPPGQQVRHLNSIGTDNRAVNLAYGTQSENEADKLPAGLANAGERHGMSKLSELDVLEIRKGLERGMTGAVLAAKYGIHKNTVYHIKKNRTWRETHASC